MRCVICFADIIREVTWTNVLKPSGHTACCPSCLSLFEKIEPACPKCSRPDSTGVCFDCERWGKNTSDPLVANRSLYLYNDFAKEWVARWKYRGDYRLIDAVAEDMRKLYKNMNWTGYPLVSVPLSEERLDERGFNQSEAIIEALGGKKQQTC